MKMSFRWYGENDKIPLAHIKQIPDTKQIVWSLHSKVAGELWEVDEIKKEIDLISKMNLKYDVVESVNVHEDIKLGLKTRDFYIDNYIKTIENLAQFNIKVICYNFMPVFDWTRTEMYKELEDGSTALFYEHAIVESIDPKVFVDNVLKDTSSYIMPGWEVSRLQNIKELFDLYKDVDENKLWDNLKYFLNRILPTCEKYNIKMAIHPDDPSWNIFGLPRIIKNEKAYEKLMSLNDSKCNCITFCSGSLGTSENNDLLKILETNLERIPFVHLRNIKRFENHDFIETAHKNSYGDVDIVGLVKILKKHNYQGYVRPDHGRHIFSEDCRPGYGLYDRALGIMYLFGIWDSN